MSSTLNLNPTLHSLSKLKFFLKSTPPQSWPTKFWEASPICQSKEEVLSEVRGCGIWLDIPDFPGDSGF